MTEVAVVGGGMAGLAVAYELSRRAVPFVLIESGPRLGGVILSERTAGYTIDAGPDALLVHKPDGIKLCEELGLSGRLIATKPPRVAFIQRNGTLHALPELSVLGIPTRMRPFLRSRLFSWAGKLRMGAELFVPPRRDEGDESIGAFMTRRFGREATAFLAEPLMAGIHAGDVDRLSAHALFPRFIQAERAHGSLLRAFRGAMAPRTPQAGDQGAFRSLPGGLTELVDAVAHALPEGSIRLNSPATRIAPGAGGGYVVETGSGESFRVRALVLATAAFVTARLARSINPDLARLCDEIPYASTATIALAFPKTNVAHPLHGSGFVVPRAEGTGILAASWMSSKWPQRAPEGHVLLRAFVGGARDPQALDRSDRELVARALGAIGPLLGISAPPLFTRVYRWERATAQHEVGHLTRLEAIERAVPASTGLFVTGSAFRGTGIPDCIGDGRATAGRLAAWLAVETPYAQEGIR
jgi:oxygen-dependent protoporphyrinogen oxidase